MDANNDYSADFMKKLHFAYALSWVVNILLLGAKLWAYMASRSNAVLASAADSAVDLVSQMVISYAEWKMRVSDPRYPVGQARLEAIGVLACACIMSVASFQVISASCVDLFNAIVKGDLPSLDMGLDMYIVLGVATLLKVGCFVVCAALRTRSDSMVALAEDHLNDVMSNLAAVGAAALATQVPRGWWIDPVGAILISIFIVWRWSDIARSQIRKIVGAAAPRDFVDQLVSLANSHHSSMFLDVIRAYHFGARYVVEMEVVMPADMTVRVSHDISLALQHKVEALPEVERAFVHVDYAVRDGLEHKVERALAIAAGRTSSGKDVQGSSGGGADADASNQGAPTSVAPAPA